MTQLQQCDSKVFVETADYAGAAEVGAALRKQHAARTVFSELIPVRCRRIGRPSFGRRGANQIVHRLSWPTVAVHAAHDRSAKPCASLDSLLDAAVAEGEPNGCRGRSPIRPETQLPGPADETRGGAGEVRDNQVALVGGQHGSLHIWGLERPVSGYFIFGHIPAKNFGDARNFESVEPVRLCLRGRRPRRPELRHARNGLTPVRPATAIRILRPGGPRRARPGRRARRTWAWV